MHIIGDNLSADFQPKDMSKDQKVPIVAANNEWTAGLRRRMAWVFELVWGDAGVQDNSNAILKKMSG